MCLELEVFGKTVIIIEKHFIVLICADEDDLDLQIHGRRLKGSGTNLFRVHRVFNAGLTGTQSTEQAFP